MANLNGMDQILTRWRDEVKRKQRRIISFDETVDIKIKSLKRWIAIRTEPVTGWEFREFCYTRHRERVYTNQEWRPISIGETWGGPDVSAEFRCNARMPQSFKGCKVALKIYFGGDGLLYIDGRPYHGLDPFRDTVSLTDCATGEETYQFTAESYIFWHFGESEIKTFECSHFAVIDQAMHDIYWDFQAAFNVMVDAAQDPDVVALLEKGMAEAVAFIDQNEANADRFRANARRAGEVLRKTIYESDRFKMPGLIHLSGNSHLDVVFLWTHAEFVRKLGRTNASTLRLMEQYPQYTFSQSQPLMYKEMKELYPTMYQEVQQRVKEGRWEVIGASWVEPDCNLISGESFTRQMLQGIRFIEKEFGVTPRTCWCPDVFGNAWTMPQILVRCGLKYFVTHKMVIWNDTNPWTKNTFWWQSPDGSRILSLVPATHFIGTIEPDHMAKHWAAFSDKKTIGESLYNYGWGDGGGGPDVEMLEYLKRYQDFPGVTPAKPITIEGALDSIAKKAAQTDLPIVNDELYLEEHRGVHTTKARLKKLNRRSERLYRQAELWASLASGSYPQKALNEGWIEILNNQFHDSLPGSHIPPVYLDLLEAYDRIQATGRQVLQDALKQIATNVDTSGAGQAVVVFNSLPQTRQTVVAVEHAKGDLHVVDDAGKPVSHQFITHFETGQSQLLLGARALPSVGCKVYHLCKGAGDASVPLVTVTPRSLENEHLKVVIDDQGQVVSLFDKAAGRECIDPVLKGNVMKLYEDVPGKYEAWDIAPTYTNVEFDLGQCEIKVVEQGPVRSAILVSRQFRNSRMTQRIVLAQGSRRVDFQTWVDWKEQQKLLKVRFNTTITSRQATYDIAYGSIDRSTYRNNSFDAAKFEVPAHQWMDISQADYGLSLLNDCKYGHEAFGKMIALTLLRGPLNPDPMSDQEEHWFTYSLYPHGQSWREAATIQEALDLNDPAIAVLEPSHSGALPSGHTFVRCSSSRLTLEALKKTEDGNQRIIRVVERHGAQEDVELRFEGGITSAVECNLLEREDAPVQSDGNAIRFTIRPYEIRTFKVSLA